MKNGKAPTREQKKIMRAHGLVPENWLVVKNLQDSLEVVSRVSLKKVLCQVTCVPMLNEGLNHLWSRLIQDNPLTDYPVIVRKAY